ncbi:MAG: hypothetical protein IKH96_07050 [Ruminococcus sp.]|uniref:hypothetical protein n=1 Tax=Ruminococcus sp. TaxID=41978 RepID=UPI0025F79551|nr:hypothetical protein [Ruminococcus sp.]MBR6995763.1 hypothetical protein [Ruminococcus sp.]
MKEITAILALLMLLTGCGQITDIRESPSTQNETSTVSAEEKMINSTSVTTITATVTTTATVQPTTAVKQETTVTETMSVRTAEAAVSCEEVTSTDNTTKATEPPQTATSAATVTIPVTTAQQAAPPIAVTEPITEPKLLLPNDGTDYGKAKAVYEYMRQNGNGTCVNHACMTYKLCCDNGLQCCLAWTDAGMYGHVANIVNVDGIWYVLDTEGGYFLDYNYCFTEVVDIDGNHITDSRIISDMSYDELH